MRRSLPSRAHLDHVRKQAKDLLTAARSGELEAADRLCAHLTRLSSKQDPGCSDVTLQEAQFVVAREYGFESWSELVREVAPTSGGLSLQVVRQVHERLLSPLKALFSTCLERPVDVAIAELRTIAIGDYVQFLGPSCWNYCFRFGRRSGGHLAFSLPLCAAVLVPGASGDEVKRRAGEMLAFPTDPQWASNERFWATHAEFRTMAEAVKVMAGDIEAAWEVAPGAPPPDDGMSDIKLEVVPSLIDTDDPRDPAVHVRFNVLSEGYEDLAVSLCYTLSMIAPMIGRLQERWPT